MFSGSSQSYYQLWGGFFIAPQNEVFLMEIAGLDFKIKEMAARIRELREIENISVEDMAAKTGNTSSAKTATATLTLLSFTAAPTPFRLTLPTLLRAAHPNSIPTSSPEGERRPEYRTLTA